MARAQLTNNAVTTLAADITSGATTITVASGTGSRFPSSGYFYVTLLDSNNIPEIVKVTNRAGDSFTVTRGQDGTSARAFATSGSGTRISLNLSAVVINELAPLDNPTFTGTVTAPAFSGPLTGNVTGNVTGNATTATSATSATNATNLVGSGTISSTTTATTQTAGTNNTTVATTAFVQTAVSSSPIVQIQPISASVATNALTISASALRLDFRSTTLTSGTVTTVSGTPSSITVPSSATLGTVSAKAARLVVLALNNAGTIELAVVNISGGTQLDETNLISTTALSAGSTSASTVYSTTARTGVAYRVLGIIDITETTAGTWASAPTMVQGIGGQALAAMSSIGYGQTWATASLSAGVTYYNTTGKPIFVSGLLGMHTDNAVDLFLTVNGVVVSQCGYGRVSLGSNGYGAASGVVPPGGTYSWSGTLDGVAILS